MNGMVPCQPVILFLCHTDGKLHLVPCKCKTCPWDPETVFRTWLRGMWMTANWN